MDMSKSIFYFFFLSFILCFVRIVKNSRPSWPVHNYVREKKADYNTSSTINSGWVDPTFQQESSNYYSHFTGQPAPISSISVDTSLSAGSHFSSSNYSTPVSAYSSYSQYHDVEKFSPRRRNSFVSNATTTTTSSSSSSSSNERKSSSFHKQQHQQQRSVLPPDGYIYQVQFKRAHRNYILAPSAPRDLLPGDFVKVEADRGEDMGIILAKCPAESFEEVIPTAGYRGRGFSSGQGERKYLFRRATNDERAALKVKVNDEEKALEVRIVIFCFYVLTLVFLLSLYLFFVFSIFVKNLLKEDYQCKS
jgi:hypothetical protein